MKIVKKLVLSALTWLVLTGILVTIDETFSVSEKTDLFSFIGILLPILGAIVPFCIGKKPPKTKPPVFIPLDNSRTSVPVVKQKELKRVYYKTPGRPKCPKCGSENIDADFNLNEDIGEQSKIGTPMRCKD